MGGNFSRGIDNETLVDKLLKSGISVEPHIERVFRLVDRGEYCTQNHSRAYIDLPFRLGTLHLSAPSIYLRALQNLDVQSGHSFLNIGSGTGYFNTVVGLLLGYNGVNHGIEANEHNVNFSRKCLSTFLTESDAPFERSFCMPLFVHGNILDLISLSRYYCNSSSERSCDEPSSVPQNATQHSHCQFTNDEPVEIYVEVDQGEDSNLMRPCATDFHTRIGVRIFNDNQDLHSSEQHSITNSDEISNGSRGFENDDDDDTESEQSLSSIGEEFPIGTVCTFNSNSDLLAGSVAQNLGWPCYDRIYVGAAVTNADHLRSIISLLKIGGILLAPYCSKFLKVNRVSETQIIASELMSVSFVNLSQPKENDVCTITAVPYQQVPTLEKLCARSIRQQLCKSIRHRISTLPVPGRFQKVAEANANDGQDNSDQNVNSDQKKVKQNRACDSQLDKHDGHSIAKGNLVLNDEESSNGLSAIIARNDSPSSLENLRRNNLIRSCWNAFRSFGTALQIELNSINTNRCSDGSSTTSADSDNADKTTANTQSVEYKWIPQNYTYKNEMFQILKNELHLSNRFVRSVLTL